jgi:CSLREA domain-containing protein
MLKKFGALLAPLQSTPHGAGKRGGRRRFVPKLERLDDREVPATFTVTTTLDVVNPADGKLSLREAVTAANIHPGSDTIVLSRGVYKIIALMVDDANSGGDFDVTGTTLFRGAGAGSTAIDGQQVDRVFDIFGTAPHSINVTFQGLTVRNGLADNGGGIRVGNADLTVRDCVVTGNRTAGTGGGISNAARPGTGNVTLFHTIVNHNVAGGDGGSIYVLGNGQIQGSVLNVIGSTIHRNLGGNAGGIRAANLNLIHSIVSGNASINSAGGIWADTATLIDSIISGNTADSTGGGILATTVTLTHSTVTGNRAVDTGGGISAQDATLTNCTVSGNTVDEVNGEGGGIFAATVRLIGSTVSGNIAANGGGISARTATLTGSTISGNFASDSGGGIRGTTATLTNSTISGNSTDLQGGGIVATNVSLLNVTVTDNSAREGGGVFLRTGGTSSVRNTIVADNVVDSVGIGPDLFGTFTSSGHNLIGDGSGSTGFTNGTNGDQVGTAANPIDPKLGPLANNGGPTKTHALRAGSPAIDHGDNSVAPATDQRGFVRSKDGDGNRSAIVDIGAFER